MARERRQSKKTPSQPQKRNKPRHNFEIKPKTPAQRRYLDSIETNLVTLCSGPAGSGKTLMAIGSAMRLYHANEIYGRIIIVRPAIEACGESLGYLPGDADDKMRPFIEPILDNLRYFITDEGYITSLLETKTIQVSPMAFMRGRTYNNCIVIFDEAQNATRKQMKLFLTRIGKNCKVIIEGDVTQSDIFGQAQEENGLYDAMKRLTRCPDIGVVKLTKQDIQRSRVVANILKRYD